MLIIQIAIILILGFALKFVYSYISNNIEHLGPGQKLVSNIVIIVIFINILFMILLVIYTTYINEWKQIGDPGEEGESGPRGDKGDPVCINKKILVSSKNC